MVRTVLSIVGIVATIGVIVYWFGFTMPQMTATMPGIRQSALHAAALEQSHGNMPEPDDQSAPGAPASGGAPHGNSPSGSPVPAPAAAPSPSVPSDQPEIISPDTAAHLNPVHIHEVDQPGTPADGLSASNPNPAAFVPPIPLPAHPQWTWDVGTREFTNVVITRVDADVVTINSDSGPAQIDIALLPAELQHALNYNATLAAQAAAARKNQPAPP
jgi:hypothetical protein